MLTADKVKDAVYSLLRGEFAGVEIHLDLLPANFTRPAIFLEMYDISTRDINRNTIEEASKTAINCLANLDKYGNTADNDLSLMSARVRKLFRDGVIYVEDRAVRCAIIAKKDGDLVRLELTATYWEERQERKQLPPMQEIKISRKEG